MLNRHLSRIDPLLSALALCAAVCLQSCTAGCAGFKLGTQANGKISSEKAGLPAPSAAPAKVAESASETPPAVTPSKLAVTWSEAILTPPNGLPTRGFGGRVYFYDAKQKAVAVDGELVVFAFDELRTPAAPAPQRKYVIRAHELPRHFGATQLGPSYSIWVPWDAAGGPENAVSLLVRFTSVSNAVVLGEPTRSVLAGPKDKTLATPWRKEGEVRAVSYDAPAERDATAGDDPRRPLPTTIALPSSLQQRLASSATEAPATANQWHGSPNVGWQAPANSIDQPTAAEQAKAPLAAHSAPGSPRVLGAPIARPIRGPAPWRPFPAVSPHPNSATPPAGS